jgi:isoquinoline 1-oxidoreductase subunit beta
LGGGFGRRGDFDQEFVVDALLMSKNAKRPVKVIWTREDDVHGGHFRPFTAHYLRVGLDAAGKLTGSNERLLLLRPAIVVHELELATDYLSHVI